LLGGTDSSISYYEFPSMPLRRKQNNEANKVLGRLWKALTNNQKQAYERKADEDKRRYLEVGW